MTSHESSPAKQCEESPSQEQPFDPDKIIFKKGDIVWVDLGLQVEAGSRLTYKERPSVILKDNQADPDYAVVVQSNLGNRHSPTIILAPLTSKEYDKNYPFIVKRKHLISKIEGLENEGSIKLDQIFTVDKIKIKGRIGSLNPFDLKKIDKALKASLQID